jgi:transcriptional regulator with XRE-family HTH domain
MRTAYVSILKPEHLRAARALLRWQQDDLSIASGVCRGTVRRMEQGGTRPNKPTVEAIRRALEANGIELLLDGDAPGARIRGHE